MGQMVDGVWTPDGQVPSKDGAFVRADSTFRGTIEPGGTHPPEPGRYHLYVSLACPWAHRTLIYRTLKGLDGTIGLSVTHWLMGEQGWTSNPARG